MKQREIKLKFSNQHLITIMKTQVATSSRMLYTSWATQFRGSSTAVKILTTIDATNRMGCRVRTSDVPNWRPSNSETANVHEETNLIADLIGIKNEVKSADELKQSRKTSSLYVSKSHPYKLLTSLCFSIFFSILVITL